MKRFLYYFFSFLFLVIAAGCSNDDNAGSGGAFGVGGGGGSNNVTFTVTLVQDNQNNTYFQFKPSTGVTIQRMTAQCQAIGLNDELTDAEIPDDVFSGTYPINVGPITVTLTKGQAWTFVVTGKVGSTTGTAFTSTVNFTVP